MQKLSKGVYFTLGGGFLLGIVSIASLFAGHASTGEGARPIPPVVTISSTRATAGLADLHALDRSFTQLAEAVSPGVVHIKTENKAKPDMLGRNMVTGGEGSGVIYRPDGYIITNDHVVGGFDKVTVVLQDGHEYNGKVIRAEDSDIAVVKIEAKDLPAVQFGNSDDVRAGQLSMAIGAPFGLENSVTVGHISALNRETAAISDGRLGINRAYFDLIQTDTPINQGNSGGPLVNVDGQVIGINTAIYSPNGGGSAGIGFSIPSNQARFIADKLIEDGKIVRSYMGVIPTDLKPYEKKDLRVEGGARLDDVPNNQPAGMAGLQKGDIVTKIGDYAVKSQMDLRNVMLRYEPGKAVPVEVLRDGKTKTFKVTLKAPPARPAVPQQQDPNFDLPPGFPDMKQYGIPFPFQGPNQPQNQMGRPRLGVSVDLLTESHRKDFKIPTGTPGVIVMSVVPGSLAEQLGIKMGDVIYQVGSQAIKTPEDLVKVVQAGAGNTVTVKLYRFENGVKQQMTVSATL